MAKGQEGATRLEGHRRANGQALRTVGGGRAGSRCRPTPLSPSRWTHLWNTGRHVWRKTGAGFGATARVLLGRLQWAICSPHWGGQEIHRLTHDQPPNGTVLTADLTTGIRAQDIGGLLWKGDFKSTAPPRPPGLPPMRSSVEGTLLAFLIGWGAHDSQTVPRFLLNQKLPGGRGLMKPPPAAL